MSPVFPGKGVVAVLKTKPETVLEDFSRILALAGLEESLPKSAETVLKMNVSWQTWYPSCSTTPWQLEGVIKAMRALGYEKLIGAHNDTVVVDVKDGEKNNKLRDITDRYGVPCVYLFENKFEWITYRPKQPFLVLDKVFPEGVRIPKVLVDKNIVHLPTVKTHVFTTITGAMKNAFGGLLHRNRHWTHSVIHETLVDLLQIQRDIHPGVFAVMDGTFAGDGPGPRAMRWHEKDIILASADQVAIDAVSARLQGFDPMKLKFLKLAHDRGLGVADPRAIRIVGYDIAQEPSWRFVQEDTLASLGQKAIYYGPLKPFEKILLQSPLVPWSYFASNFYHNVYWYPFVGRPRVAAALATKWGRFFREYGDGQVIMPGMERKTVALALSGLIIIVLAALLAASRML